MSPSRIKHNEHRVIAQTSPDQTRQLNHKTTLRVVVHVGGRTRQRRSPAGTRRADRRPAWVCGLSPVTARLVCRERYHGGCDQCSKKDTFRRVLWVERANARMRERNSASVDPALRVAVRAGGRTRQRRSPAGTRRADRRSAWVCGLSPMTRLV